MRESKIKGSDSYQKDELYLGQQALQFLKAQRVSRVDASRHLNILLNAELFTAQEVAENAKLLLKFVSSQERMAA